MSKSNGVKMVELEPHQRLAEKQQRELVKMLKVLLADESLLYTKLRNYHWNVTGAHFYALHMAFEDQYNEVANMADEVAERIRQYGANAPGTMDEFIRKSRLSEEPRIYPDAQTMISNLVTDHEAIIRFLYKDIENIGKEAGEVGVVDLLTRLSQQHEKMAWMLRMCVEGQIAVSKA